MNVASGFNSAVFDFSFNIFSFANELELLLDLLLPDDLLLLILPFDEALDEVLSAESLNQLWTLRLKLDIS